SILEAMQKDGFSFIEVISPCPTAYGRRNAQKDAMETMKFYQYKTRVKNGADPKEADITLTGEILTGKFVDIEKTTYMERLRMLTEKALKKGA
ncbi:MAG: 2-oxoacid:ferredoxin oxidoreductase subunit beta, partial [Thermoplasmata archaeon]